MVAKSQFLLIINCTIPGSILTYYEGLNIRVLGSPNYSFPDIDGNLTAKFYDRRDDFNFLKSTFVNYE